jgi:hypothetical protein
MDDIHLIPSPPEPNNNALAGAIPPPADPNINAIAAQQTRYPVYAKWQNLAKPHFLLSGIH